MKITVTLNLDITPGSYTEDQIKADVEENLRSQAMMLGFGYGALPYTVNSVSSS